MTRSELTSKVGSLFAAVESNDTETIRFHGPEFATAFSGYMKETSEHTERLAGLAKAGLWVALQEHQRAEQFYNTNRLMMGARVENFPLIKKMLRFFGILLLMLFAGMNGYGFFCCFFPLHPLFTAIGQRPMFVDGVPSEDGLLLEGPGLSKEALDFLAETPVDPAMHSAIGDEGIKAMKKILTEERRVKIPWLEALQNLAARTHGRNVSGIKEEVLTDPSNIPFVTLQKNRKGVSNFISPVYFIFVSMMLPVLAGQFIFWSFTLCINVLFSLCFKKETYLRQW